MLYSSIMLEIFRLAFAKVNFGLKVLPKREDGFHNIESIFQTVSLNDKIIVREKIEKGCSVICRSMELPAENTITKTYDAFCRITGIQLSGLEVEIVKGIPSGGGLGGGSSDAAAFLSALQDITKLSLSQDQIREISALVGSDVFFFTAFKSGKGCALVSGRGENVYPIKGRDDLFLLLVFPPVSSSTKTAYQLVDDYLAKGIEDFYPAFDELENVYNSPVNEWNFCNTFLPSIVESYPIIGSALKDVKETGAFYSSMSGSGSTVYGLYSSKDQALNAKKLLESRWNCTVSEVIC